MKNQNEYPLIFFHGRTMGSHESWVENEIRKAKSDNAPADAWAKIDGRWATIESCKSDYKPRLQKAWDKHLEQKK